MNVEEKKQWIGKWNKNSNSKHIGSQESHEKMLNIVIREMQISMQMQKYNDI